MMLTQNGKLLYISDNAAEYLGHSMVRTSNILIFWNDFLPKIRFQEDLLIHGDSVYDIIDKQDHGSIQAELGRSALEQPGSHITPSPASLEGEHRMFLCRMNVSRNARRQMRFGDQKVSFDLCSTCDKFNSFYSTTGCASPGPLPIVFTALQSK